MHLLFYFFSQIFWVAGNDSIYISPTAAAETPTHELNAETGHSESSRQPFAFCADL